MRIEFVEPFDHYPASLLSSTAGAFGTQWIAITATNGPSLVTGLDGTGKSLLIPRGLQSNNYRRPFVTPDSKLSLHFAFSFDTLQSITGDFQSIPFICVDDEAGVQQFALGMDINGRMRLYGEGGAQVALSSRVFNSGTVYRCSLTADASVANATVISLAVNSTTPDANFNAITVDAQDTASQLFGGLHLRQTHNEYDVTIDDIVVGLEECVLWGPLEVALQPPNLDSAVTWTRSAGATNFGNVDDIPFTGDADYNYSSTVGQKDKFGITDPIRVPETIVAVSQLTLARKEDSATRKIRNVLTKAGVDYNGADQDMSESYYHHWEHWELDPATVAAWNPADFAALESGYENRL